MNYEKITGSIQSPEPIWFHPVVKVLREKLPYRDWNGAVKAYLNNKPIPFSMRLAIKRELDGDDCERPSAT